MGTVEEGVEVEVEEDLVTGEAEEDSEEEEVRLEGVDDKSFKYCKHVVSFCSFVPSDMCNDYKVKSNLYHHSMEINHHSFH